MDVNGLSAVESSRLRLDQNVAKLRKALYHWRQWDAEYEGLKEELQTIPDTAGRETLSTLSHDFGGDLVDEKEIQDLAGISKPPLRTPRTIINLVQRRQDYVNTNIATITKQLANAELSLSELEQDEDDIDDPSSGDLPVTEITEELDEDGNIISSKTSRPGDSTAGIVDALRKAGISDIPGATDTSLPANGVGSPSRPDSIVEAQPSTTISQSSPAERPAPVQKSVSFSEDTKAPADASALSHSLSADRSVPVEEPEPALNDIREPTIDSNRAPAGSKIVNTAVDPHLLNGTFGGGSRVYELDDDDEVIGASAVIPENESAEDARLRREMLAYSLNEVGPIVAELDLEEGDTDGDDDDLGLDDIGDDFEELDDFGDEDIEMYADTSDEEEDQFGRTTKRVISDDYRQQMRDLEDKLSGAVIGNLGPDGKLEEMNEELNEETDNDYGAQDAHLIVVRKTPEDEPVSAPTASPILTRPSVTKQDSSESTKAKKSVRFAEKLETQEPPRPVPTINDVQEHATAPGLHPAAGLMNSPRSSRFKAARQAARPSSATPAQPVFGQDQVLRDAVTERAPAKKAKPTAPSADEFDPELQRKELAAEYYRMRNNVIKQQGGFKAEAEREEENGEGPLMEEVEGKVKKVSRFKAARMKH